MKILKYPPVNTFLPSGVTEKLLLKIIMWLTINPNVCPHYRNLAEMLGMNEYEYHLKDAALVDYHFGNLWWSKERGYNALQIWDVMKIGYELLLQTQRN